jgi:hypothetical protein
LVLAFVYGPTVKKVEITSNFFLQILTLIAQNLWTLTNNEFRGQGHLTRALSSLGSRHVRAICGSLSRGPLHGNVVFFYEGNVVFACLSAGWNVPGPWCLIGPVCLQFSSGLFD